MVFELISPTQLILAVLITFLAGTIKGSVGFAMPMIMISGLGSFLAPDIALAALILPTVVSNLMQALRSGITAALKSLRQFRRFVGIFLVVLVIVAQLVRGVTPSLMFLAIGIPITLLSLVQLLGWRPKIKPKQKNMVEAVSATLSGITGGFAGVWGPTTTAYLTAINTPKSEQIRIQGVIYAVGAVVLFLAHLKSGILNEQTLPLSFWLIVPASFGMFAGFKFQDRLDQEKFTRLTLAVLVIAGLNLVRRGLWG